MLYNINKLKICPAIGLAVLMLAPTISYADDHESEASMGRLLAASCASCHGTNGKAQDAMPALAGRSKEVLIEQMHAFKSGKRNATVMHQLAKGYNDRQIELIADYFSKQ